HVSGSRVVRQRDLLPDASGGTEKTAGGSGQPGVRAGRGSSLYYPGPSGGRTVAGHRSFDPAGGAGPDTDSDRRNLLHLAAGGAGLRAAAESGVFRTRAVFADADLCLRLRQVFRGLSDHQEGKSSDPGTLTGMTRHAARTGDDFCRRTLTPTPSFPLNLVAADVSRRTCLLSRQRIKR